MFRDCAEQQVLEYSQIHRLHWGTAGSEPPVASSEICAGFWWMQVSSKWTVISFCITNKTHYQMISLSLSLALITRCIYLIESFISLCELYSIHDSHSHSLFIINYFTESVSFWKMCSSGAQLLPISYNLIPLTSYSLSLILYILSIKDKLLTHTIHTRLDQKV